MMMQRTIPFFLAAFVLLAACNKDPYMPDGPATRVELVNSDATHGGKNDAQDKLAGIRYMTYNIRHCSPPSAPGTVDVAAIAKVINDSDADIIFLQEVDKNTGRDGYSGDQAQDLATRTSRNVAFFSAISYQKGFYGVAILSKYPLKSIKKYFLTKEQADHEQRVLGTAIVDLPGIDSLVVGVTHLQHNSNGSRVQQVKEVTNILGREETAVLVGGDLNENPSATDFFSVWDATFTRTCTGGCGNTYSAQSPTSQIDHLAFRPAAAFSVQSHTVISEPYASDHLPVVANLKFNR
ncbi:MAG: endonuclease/exonuclease/phosphatase family protein [Candidatus Pseudobacter hemicellulosilyticus]|uniref:Endonuclease/exonuclease/phosphatase family protein n=1 Tax=Candidatus Pseudobacter hemicellulosilyticus TaxID=3121375 RepID=A0AAJ5WTR3_9BACT|nr:MAG: endonuclease/exonuclease/phosphatase family protein [Pseudobacter sp.]